MTVEDQARLLCSLQLVRELLASPSALTDKTIVAARSVAVDLGDRVHFNLGWHAGNPGKELRGSSSVRNINSEIAPLLDLLAANVKPKRGVGRPQKDIDLVDLPIIIEHLKTGASVRGLVDASFKNGGGLDKTKTTDAHVKRIERCIAKLKEVHSPKTNNILHFRPLKTARRKFTGK